MVKNGIAKNERRFSYLHLVEPCDHVDDETVAKNPDDDYDDPKGGKYWGRKRKNGGRTVKE